MQDFGCAKIEHLQILFNDKNNNFKNILDSNMISKKGDTMIFRIWKGNGMHWENTITVTDCREYKKSEKSLLKLISATYPYHTDRMRSIKAYETKVKKGQMDEPNLTLLKKDLKSYEEDNF